MRAASFAAIFFAAGCFGGPSADPPAARGGHAPGQITTMAAPPSADPTPADGGTTTPPPATGTPDLGGLVDCFGAAVCDPTQMFCIKYFSGSQAAPGTVVSGPACYEPDDTCANQGQNMDCGCIQNDDILGPSCQGGCVDNGDNTFFCFAQS